MDKKESSKKTIDAENVKLYPVLTVENEKADNGQVPSEGTGCKMAFPITDGFDETEKNRIKEKLKNPEARKRILEVNKKIMESLDSQKEQGDN
ncbi:MAG: hypothetical protein PHX51_02340 [Clostridia bacterium]|nr:hypothetical protein [Clostridia bacterium]